MTYKIIDFTGDSSGTITANLKAAETTLHSISDVTVKSAFDNETVFEVTNEAALINAARTLLDSKIITLETSGQTVSTSNMNFKIKVIIELEVVANPL
jgi:flavin-binding protein dodecin